MKITRCYQTEVETIEPGCSAETAALRMAKNNLGSLVVADEQQRLVGILTDRDLTVRVLAERRDPGETTVGDIMTPDPHTTTESASAEDALDVMRRYGIRRLLVVAPSGDLLGIVTLDDILRSLRLDLTKVEEILRWSSPMPDALSL